MREVVFDYAEFKEKVDLGKPIHHCAYSRCIDRQHGVFYRITFQIMGISKNGNHVVMWIAERRTTISERDRNEDKNWYDKLVKDFALPLGSTEGEWKP